MTGDEYCSNLKKYCHRQTVNGKLVPVPLKILMKAAGEPNVKALLAFLKSVAVAVTMLKGFLTQGLAFPEQ